MSLFGVWFDKDCPAIKDWPEGIIVVSHRTNLDVQENKAIELCKWFREE